MDPQLFIQSLLERGVELGIHSGALCYSDPCRRLTLADHNLLHEQKEGLVAHLIGVTSDSATGSRHQVPLTFQHVFMLTHLDNAFAVPFVFRISGDVDRGVFAASVNLIVKRHDALRARLIVENGCLLQRVTPVAAAVFEDLGFAERGISPDAQNTAALVERLYREWLLEAKETFSVKLLTTGDAEHVLVLLWDHIAFDSRSITLLLKELQAAYASGVNGHGIALPHNPMQYSDYAIWQRDQHARVGKEHDSYWNARLRDAAPIEIPVDRTTISSRDSSYGYLISAFKPDVDSWFKATASRIGVAKSFVAITLLVIALAVWARQRCFTIPMTIAGRYSKEHLPVIGLFVGFLPLRIDLDSYGSFDSACKAIASGYLSAVPFMSTGKSPDGGNPALLNGPYIQWIPDTPDKCLGSAHGEGASKIVMQSFQGSLAFNINHREARIPVLFDIHDFQEAVTLIIAFRTRYFKRESAERFSQMLIRLAENVTADSSMTVDALLRSVAS